MVEDLNVNSLMRNSNLLEFMVWDILVADERSVFILKSQIKKRKRFPVENGRNPSVSIFYSRLILWERCSEASLRGPLSDTNFRATFYRELVSKVI